MRRFLTSAPAAMRGGRRPLLSVLAALAAAGTLTGPSVAAAQAEPFSDAFPTAQAVAANAEFLTQAPPPPGGAGAVCVIDTGVTYMRDLGPSQVTERLAVGGGTVEDVDHHPGDPLSGHGSFVASAIASQVDGWGAAGLWPHAKIVSVRVFPEGGGGAASEDYRSALYACQQQERNVRVINLSLGGVEASPDELMRLEDRIGQIRDLGLNVVAAAGNGDGGPIDYPARFGQTFAVGAADGPTSPCGFSSRGPELDLLTPTCAPQLALHDGRLARFAGTSYASPLVSAALLALRAYRPDLTADQAEHLLVQGARTGAAGKLLDVASTFRAAGLGDVVDAYRAPRHRDPQETRLREEAAVDTGTPSLADQPSSLADAPAPAVQPVPEAPKQEEPTPVAAMLPTTPVRLSPARPQLRRITHSRGRLVIELRRVPEAGVVRFTVDGRTYVRNSTRLSVRTPRWRRVVIVAEDAWGASSKPLVRTRRH